MRADSHSYPEARSTCSSRLVAVRPIGLRQPLTDQRIIGASTPLVALKLLIERVATSVSTILITGESGTGKELVARTIHDLSERAGRPYLAINCGAFTESLLESELFGYVKGAFTGATGNKKGVFEAAQGGTIFLDEVGEMAPAMQVKLLRVLQERKVRPVGATQSQEIGIDVRVIAATNRDMRREVNEGRFREDLFYRLNVIPVQVPPLRERLDDIPHLINHLLHKVHKRAGLKAPAKIGQHAQKLLCGYHWPGNVRELENTLERLSVLAGSGSPITAEEVREIMEPHAKASQDLTHACGRKAEAHFEAQCDHQKLATYRQMLKECGGNHSEVARRLRIGRVPLLKRMKRIERRLRCG